MEVNDAAVVAQVLAGDRDAFRVLVERHSRSIFRVVYRMTGNQQDSEELVQETFLRAYKSLERFELRANFSTWLYRIAVNRTLDFLTARKTQMQNKDTYQIVDQPDPEEGNQIQLPSPTPGQDRLLISAEMKQPGAGFKGERGQEQRVPCGAETPAAVGALFTLRAVCAD